MHKTVKEVEGNLRAEVWNNEGCVLSQGSVSVAETLDKERFGIFKSMNVDCFKKWCISRLFYSDIFNWKKYFYFY
jgi:hypothetical protein